MWVYICQGDKMKVTKGRGYVYSIQYHVVWCVKYRYKVLMDDIEKRFDRYNKKYSQR